MTLNKFSPSHILFSSFLRLITRDRCTPLETFLWGKDTKLGALRAESRVDVIFH